MFKPARWTAYVVVAALTISTVVTGADVASGADDEVTFALNWLPVGEATGWYTALERGFFRDEKLNVSIVRGLGSPDTARRVAAGRAHFGVADTGSVIMLRINESVKVKTVAMFFGRAPHGVFFKKGAGISNPKALEGKTIGCPAASANRIMFPAFANTAGVDASKIIWRITDPGVVVPTLAAGRVDAICNFVTERPVMEAQVKEGVDALLFRDHGLDFYANGIVVREELAQKNPDLVRRFTRAAVRGLDYAMKHPDESVGYLLKHAPENVRDIAAKSWQITTDLIQTDEAKKNGTGYMLPAKMKATYDVVTSAFGLDAGKDDYRNLFSNEFLR
jgi:NitT/TauT family transport system substrate-binding protein